MKRNYQVSVSFIDKYTGEYRGDNIEQAVSKFSNERKEQLMSLAYQAVTGKRVKVRLKRE
jgi:hypothetical protein